MSTQFPYSKDSFTDKVDNTDAIMASDFNNIYSSIMAIQSTFLSFFKADESMLLLCHFNDSVSGHRNQTGSYSGPLRYDTGVFYNGVFLEEGTTNLVTNPAFREDLTNWTVYNGGAGSCTGYRITTDYPANTDGDFDSSYKIQVTTAGNVDSSIYIDLGSLSADTEYAISFWVKTEDSFSTTKGVYISSGAGLQVVKSTQMSYSATSSWQRVTGSVTTGSGQSSFYLEICFEKSGATLGEKILFCGVQVEEKGISTTYCDGSLGTGYSWSGTENESTSIRSNTSLTYSTANNLDLAVGSIGFWIKPTWDGDDDEEHIFFDAAVAANQNRIQIKKDSSNKLCFTIWDNSADSYAKETSDSAVSWEAEDLILIVCTYDSGTLKIYKGEGSSIGQVSTTSSGAGSGEMGSLPSTIYLGHDYSGANNASGIYDEFFIKDEAISSTEVSNIFNLSQEMTAVRFAMRGIPAGWGSATSDASIGTQATITHNLGSTPSFVEITEKGAGVVYLSAESDSANFYVKSTASSVDFDWRVWL